MKQITSTITELYIYFVKNKIIILRGHPQIHLV